MTVNLAHDLDAASIRTHAVAADWRAAITLAGDALAAGGVTTDVYTAEMIAAVEKLGPYIVIAPGLAIAHSRPSPAVLRAGLSWVTLETPVSFGHKKNDPVSLIVGLAAPDHDGHLEMMQALAGVLMNTEQLAALKNADSPAEVLALMSTPELTAERKAHS
ncbi:PTS sugar transporter subunit IIA [Cryobacterium melibiosiphilum]|uniref:Ascorbate-specific PTS system EIIA component n=1 Tax=Cryobacterium melibiosiphilum TaxID=995039 RepID=A0A3A5MFP5_9MICO|nr:PTS sugar transporter subunit IIA [Cryobacterium melibiosiphilum]RJT88990.1 PTS sugar transporter subunit IIA [Cryobacterium melibiosiphilum]